MVSLKCVSAANTPPGLARVEDIIKEVRGTLPLPCPKRCLAAPEDAQAKPKVPSLSFMPPSVLQNVVTELQTEIMSM